MGAVRAAVVVPEVRGAEVAEVGLAGGARAAHDLRGTAEKVKGMGLAYDELPLDGDADWSAMQTRALKCCGISARPPCVPGRPYNV